MEVSFCYAAALGLLFPLLPGLTGPVENAGWVLWAGLVRIHEITTAAENNLCE